MREPRLCLRHLRQCNWQRVIRQVSSIISLLVEPRYNSVTEIVPPDWLPVLFFSLFFCYCQANTINMTGFLLQSRPLWNNLTAWNWKDAAGGVEPLIGSVGSDHRADLILAISNDDPCSMVIWGCLHNWNFPMQLSDYACASFPRSISLFSFFFFFFSPPVRPRAVLPLDCITCSAPVWLSLVGWWSFLAGYENQSEFLAPTFPHTRRQPHHLRHHALAHSHCCFFFPDCNASVHKGCRDSLPVCAKVKMKVQ